jgi:hypothetical protein
MNDLQRKLIYALYQKKIPTNMINEATIKNGTTTRWKEKHEQIRINVKRKKMYC